MQSRFRTAFTLIELLVVVTIIVVLLALLTPALDKAIYQAELTICEVRLKVISTGVTKVPGILSTVVYDRVHAALPQR